MADVAAKLKLADSNLDTLQNQADKIEADICKSFMDEGANASVQENLLKLREAYGFELNRRAATQSAPIKIEPSAGGALLNAASYRNLDVYFKDKVPEFGPGNDISTFIAICDQGFELLSSNEADFEKNFCERVSMKLSTQYSSCYLKAVSKSDRQKWANVKAYLRKTYASKETIFQTLSHLWDLERKPSESIHTFGARMEEKGAEVQGRIESIWAEKHENETPVPELKVTDYTNIISSMLVLQHIRLKDPDVYKSMINELDKCFKPTDITVLAQTYVDRFGQTEPANVDTAAYVSKPKVDKKSLDCFSWKRHGKCRRGETCSYKHDPKFKKKKTEPKDNTPPSGQHLAVGDNGQYISVGNEIFRRG